MNHAPSIKVYDTLDELSSHAADLIVARAKDCISDHHSFSLVLSGGNTPRVLYEMLASPAYRDLVDWKQVQIYFGDERYVPHTDEQSNFRMANETLLARVPIIPQHIFPIPTQSFPKEDAERYEALLREKYPMPWPRFDLVLLGLGDNGHTASLFPHTAVLHENHRWVKEVFVEELKAYRITLTAGAINAAASILFLVAGAGKASVLNQVLYGERDYQQLPAQLIEPADGDVIYMLDSPAAALLHQ